jgi:hypothetical protein
MKTAIGVILGIFLGIVIVGVAVWLVFFNTRGNTPSPSTLASATAKPAVSVPSLTPSASFTPATTPAQAAKTPSSTSNPVSSSSPLANVNFSLNITGVSTSGLSATVNSQLTNTGTSDAHNVQAKVEVFSQGSKVNVTGDTSFSLGTIKAGEAVTKQAVFNFSLLDAPKLMQNGATFNLTLSSDEKTQTLTYDYHP